MFHLHHRLSYISRLTITALLGLFALFIVRPVLAQGGHTFRLQPDLSVTSSTNKVYFVYDSSPSAVIADSVLVKNTANSPIQLALYPGDAITASDGGVSIDATLGETPSGAGSWIQLSESEVTLEPNEERSIPFTVNIPDGISPGEYAATIVTEKAETDEEVQQNGPVGLYFIPRVGLSVLITIPGPEPLEPQLEIAQLVSETETEQEIIAELRNIGNDGIRQLKGT